MAVRIRRTDAWGATYKGRKPGPNQDRVLVAADIIREGHISYAGDPPLIIAVADGISGDAGGDIAAQTALETVRDTAPGNLKSALHVMAAANTNIHAAAAPTAGMRNMCTTIAVVWLHKNKLIWCARGDTPIFLVTDSGTVQANALHTGKYGLLTSYLGANAVVTPESTSFGMLELKPAEVQAAAVTSDGICKYIPDETLLGMLADDTRQIAAIGSELMRSASANGSPDNLSFVMARFWA